MHRPEGDHETEAAELHGSVSATLRSALARASEREALVTDELRLTRGELLQKVEATAATLSSQGFGPGDRCVVHGVNSWRWCVGALAAFSLGMTVAPLSGSICSRERLEPILQRIRPDLVLAGSAKGSAALLPVLQTCSWDAFRVLRPSIIDMTGDPSAHGPTLDDLTAQRSAPLQIAASESFEGHTALILLTSGTTGQPKAVAHSHASIVSLLGTIGATPHRELLTTPLSHLFGQWQLLTMVMGGGCLILPSTAAFADLASLIVRENISLLSGPPSMFTRMLAAGRAHGDWLESLKRVMVAADMVPARVLDALLDAELEVEDLYGMTECPCVASAVMTRRDDTAKRLWSGADVRVVDDSGRPVAAGRVGAIEVRGDRLCQGYLDAEGQPVPVTNTEGWFRTGDLAHLDEAGHLALHGRSREMFICHGHNVFPAEVERHMMRSGLLAGAVLVARPSRLSGQEGVAFVVPENPANFDRQALRQWLRTRLEPWKMPVRFVVMTELPVNENGKIDRDALSDQACERPIAERGARADA